MICAIYENVTEQKTENESSQNTENQKCCQILMTDLSVETMSLSGSTI